MRIRVSRVQNRILRAHMYREIMKRIINNILQKKINIFVNSLLQNSYLNSTKI